MNKMKNFQRNGATSNAEVGRNFEIMVQEYFANQTRLNLVANLSLEIGVDKKKKKHTFDLGNIDQKIIVECKSHTWTESGNVPSAKLAVWNEAMYYFYISPQDYKKIFVALKDFSQKKNETLAEYYIRTHEHLIPPDVEIWEYNLKNKCAEKLNTGKHGDNILR